MKPFLLLAFLVLSIPLAKATHLIGGYVQAKSISTTSLTYQVTLVLYMNEVQGKQAADQADSYPICFGDGTTKTAVRSNRLFINDRTASISSYTLIHTYSGPSTYSITASVPNRTLAQNITNADSQLFTLGTTISATLQNQTPTPDYPITSFRLGLYQKATLSLKATDADGDSLVYGLAKSLTNMGTDVCSQQAVKTYQFPNDLTRQGTFKLNNQTGDLVWDSPTKEGNYSVAITIYEYRRGLLISQTTQEITLLVLDLPGTPGSVPAYEPAIEGNNGIVTGTVVYSDPDILFVTFPNPVEGPLQVVIRTSNPTTATIQLMDANGRKLHELGFSKASRHHEQLIGMDSLTPGIYMLRADVNGRSLVRKVVKK
ncbi:hypothetical protein GCM10028805_30210 [Spirosoma harenae]